MRALGSCPVLIAMMAQPTGIKHADMRWAAIHGSERYREITRIDFRFDDTRRLRMIDEQEPPFQCMRMTADRAGAIVAQPHGMETADPTVAPMELNEAVGHARSGAAVRRGT